jgi:hypothetical protein
MSFRLSPSIDDPEWPRYSPCEGKGSSIIWALTIFLYGIDERDTCKALMNLELSIMKGKETSKTVALEL